eukprot:3190258-Rhodomonas_salina.3
MPIVLRRSELGCYAMPGTELGYAATLLLRDVRGQGSLEHLDLSDSDLTPQVPRNAYAPTRPLRHVRYRHRLGLMSYAIASTHMRYTCFVLRGLCCYEQACNCIGPHFPAVGSPICLRACYEMSGTAIAYGATKSASLLRACYAMPGTDLGYLPTGMLRDVRY